MPKISVILPVYNVAQYLRQCLDSIINQSLKELEIICVNDGSTDNSALILEEYAAKDKRFIIINQENCGQGVARNKGLEIASGEYVAFVDPDDWIDLSTFEAAYDMISRNNADILSYDFKEYKEAFGRYKKKCFADELKKVYNIDIKNGQIYNNNLLKGHKLTAVQLYVWNKLYSREFINRHCIRFAENKFAEDHIFSIAAFLNANSICYLSRFLYYYRTRKTNNKKCFSDDNFCIFENIDLLKNYLIEHGFFEELKDEFEKYRYNVYIWHYNKVFPKSRERYLQLCRKNLSDSYFSKLSAKVSGNFIYKFLNGLKHGHEKT